MSLTLGQQFKVAVTAHGSSAQIVLDDEDWNLFVAGDDYGTKDAGFGENHMVAFGPDVDETVMLKNTDQYFIRYWAKLWHAPSRAAN